MLQLCHIIICQIKQLSWWKFKGINVDSIKADFEEILKKVYTYTEHMYSLKSRGKSEWLFFAQFGSSDDWPCARVSSCDSWMLLAGPTTSSLPFKIQQSTVSTDGFHTRSIIEQQSFRLHTYWWIFTAIANVDFTFIVIVAVVVWTVVIDSIVVVAVMVLRKFLLPKKFKPLLLLFCYCCCC